MALQMRYTIFVHVYKYRRIIIIRDLHAQSRNHEVLEGDELQILEETVRQYETATRRALDFSDVDVAPLPLASCPTSSHLNPKSPRCRRFANSWCGYSIDIQYGSLAVRRARR